MFGLAIAKRKFDKYVKNLFVVMLGTSDGDVLTDSYNIHI